MPGLIGRCLLLFLKMEDHMYLHELLNFTFNQWITLHLINDWKIAWMINIGMLQIILQETIRSLSEIIEAEILRTNAEIQGITQHVSLIYSIKSERVKYSIMQHEHELNRKYDGRCDFECVYKILIN